MYVERSIPRLIKYRDDWIDKSGQMVSVIRPESISTNVYGDTTVVSSENIHKIPMVINWQEYRLLLSFSDASEENNVPLVAIVRLIDNLPKGTLVKIETFSADAISDESFQWFRIVKTNAYHEILQHGKRVTMVVQRGVTFK